MMNVLDLRGPEFLEFYLLLLGAMTLLAVFMRRLLSGPDSEMPGFTTQLDPYEVAYLAGGPRLAVNAAIASLLQAEIISIESGGGKLRPTETGAAPEPGIPSTVYANIARGGSSVRRLHRMARKLTDGIATRLRAAGLAITPGQAAVARLMPAALLLVVLAIGIAKIVVGTSRNKPIGFLAFLCAATAVISLQFALRPLYRTRAANRMLTNLRRSNAALGITARSDANLLTTDDLALAMALFGPAVLSAGSLMTFRQLLRPAGSSGDGGGGSSCGGGSCGGGGCGGGGCGGCGGG